MWYSPGIRRGPAALALVAALALAVSAMGEPVDAGGKSLTGVTWTWQGTQLNDGKTLVPADPARYTLEFMADGRVALRADCNRGFGGYTLDGNRLDFGPLATTLIACPPGSLDGVFLRQLGQVTSYLFVDSDLILELALDSGGMRFSPAMTAGGATTAPAGAVVSGTVTYRERIALPDDAVVTVQIEDSSRADAPAMVIGEQVIPTMGRQVPLPFSVSYDPAAINPSARYTLRVRVTLADGRLLFITDTAYPVITRDAPISGIDVVVVRAE
jgi:uncharacterized lipoprotein YbaY